MTGDENLFSSFTPKKGGFVSYGDNDKGKILGFGTIGNSPSLMIEEVFLVDALKHNFLSISQLCYKGNNVTFDSSRCWVIKFKSNETLFTSSRSRNIYALDLNKIHSNDVCLMSNEDESLLRHSMVTHIHTDHLNKLVRKDLVVGLSYLHF